MIEKVLFVGLGSAGQRHLRNLLEILGDGIEIMAYRFHKSERVFNSDMQVIEDETLTDKYKIKEIDDYGKALDEEPDIVIIANPNNMHIPFALEAAKKGIDIFIEKPLAVTLEHTNELVEIINRKGVICQVGFQYRYHPCIRLAKEYLEKKKIGEVISVNAEVGERLSKMHCYENYHSMIESHQELGGGVVVCQSHELDYLFWLFGEPFSVYSIGGKRSGYDIDVEDTASSILRYKDNEKEFAVIIHQDFLQHPSVRRCTILGTEGRVELDLLGGRFLYEGYETNVKQEKYFKNFVRNDMFLEEMRHFINCVKIRKNPECDVQAALASTRMGLIIKESIRVEREIRVDEFLNVV